MATIIRHMLIIPNLIKQVLYFKMYAKFLLHRDTVCLLYTHVAEYQYSFSIKIIWYI